MRCVVVGVVTISRPLIMVAYLQNKVCYYVNMLLCYYLWNIKLIIFPLKVGQNLALRIKKFVGVIRIFISALGRLDGKHKLVRKDGQKIIQVCKKVMMLNQTH